MSNQSSNHDLADLLVGHVISSSLPVPGRELVLVVAHPDFSLHLEVFEEPAETPVPVEDSPDAPLERPLVHATHDLTSQFAELVALGATQNRAVPASLAPPAEGEEDVDLGTLLAEGPFPLVMSARLPGTLQPFAVLNEATALEYVTRGLSALLAAAIEKRANDLVE